MSALKNVYVFKVSRQRGRFAGFSLHLSHNGYADRLNLCYKNGPQLPPLNFTTTCFTVARFVTFYNERLNDVTYPPGYETGDVSTELCEVVVQGKNVAENYRFSNWMYNVFKKVLISLFTMKYRE